MRRSDIITLISAGEKKINERGFAIPAPEQRCVVFGNKKAAWHSEFFEAQQLGIAIKFKIDIYSIDYNGEEYAEYEGGRYKVLRTEESKNGEFVELTLSDLSERGGTDGNG